MSKEHFMVRRVTENKQQVFNMTNKPITPIVTNILFDEEHEIIKLTDDIGIVSLYSMITYDGEFIGYIYDTYFNAYWPLPNIRRKNFKNYLTLKEEIFDKVTEDKGKHYASYLEHQESIIKTERALKLRKIGEIKDESKV